MHRVRRAFLSLTIFLSCSCSPGFTPTRPAEVPGPTPQAARLVLPFDAYVLSGGELNLAGNAIDVLMRACMRAQGHPWEIIERPLKAKMFMNRGRYGPLEEEVARRFGYHPPPQFIGTDQELSRREERRNRRLSPEAGRAAFDPRIGCSRRSDDLLWRAGRPDTEQLSEYGAQTMRASQRDPQVRAAIDAWAKCMKGKGFSYTHPFEATDDPRWTIKGRALETEIKTALTDVECKDTTHLVDIWFSTERNMQKELVRRNQPYFSALLRKKIARVTSARETLNEFQQ
ncbi:hypothetical protein [Streptomyces tsukubensis]|uniref:hypothetical protein n=1 Tax=Streptomyces tsukubensis TaxID=83656 RepID=UPI00344FC84A